MGKMKADGLKKISVSDLKRYGFLSGVFHSGILSWTSRDGETNNVSISVWTTPDKPLLRITYSSTNRTTGEKRDYTYDIPLTTTPCRYGGRRWWFTCIMSRNGRYCGRRVGKLYLGDSLFACRHCYNLTYASCNASARYKGFVSIPDIDAQEAKVKRTHYAGKPTKQYRKLLKMEWRFDASFIAMAAKLGIKAGKQGNGRI